MFGHIVVPVDGSAGAEQILPAAVALAVRFGSGVSLLRTIPAPEQFVVGAIGAMPINPEPAVAALREEAEAYVRKVAGELRSHGLRVEALLGRGQEKRRQRRQHCRLAALVTQT